MHTYFSVLSFFSYVVFSKEWIKFCFLMMITTQWDTWALGASLGYFFILLCEAELKKMSFFAQEKEKYTLFQFISVFTSTNLRGDRLEQ